MRKHLILFFSLLVSLGAGAQTTAYQKRVLEYIEQYKALAMAEQQRTGIPASITLGQGILETQAGASELATKANNHFGIKCKKAWTGATFTHTDDAPDECFRAYPSALHSYKDHSDYLVASVRYKPCFDKTIDDYKGWATQLRACGYATNPRYAQQLINIIEDYKLDQYTEAAMKGAAIASVSADAIPAKTFVGEVVPEQDAPVPVTIKAETATQQPAAGVQQMTAAEEDGPVVYGRQTSKNGLKGFYARKGDLLLEHAIKYGIRYAKLLDLNDLPDAPLEADMFIYTERKHSKGMRPAHTVLQDETMRSIAQEEGIQLKALFEYNKMNAGDRPAPGVILVLQPAAGVERPETVAVAEPAAGSRSTSPTGSSTEQAAADGYVPTTNTTTDKEDAVSPDAANYEEEVAIGYGAVPPAKQADDFVQTSSAPAETPVNIANETAVEETIPAEEALPKDEFSRLKARLDKAVYSENKAPVKPAPAKAAPAQQKDESPVTQTTSNSAKTEAVYHTVAAGETMYGIAKKYNVGVRRIMDLNNLSDFKGIQKGQKLRVK